MARGGKLKRVGLRLVFCTTATTCTCAGPDRQRSRPAFNTVAVLRLLAGVVFNRRIVAAELCRGVA